MSKRYIGIIHFKGTIEIPCDSGDDAEDAFNELKLVDVENLEITEVDLTPNDE